MQLHPAHTIETKAYYRSDIDGLRAVAVCLVILHHLFPESFKNGFLGVDVFFVISGFVVTQALERNLRQGLLAGLREFYPRRIKRILPALLCHILAAITLSCLLIPPSELRRVFATAAAAIAAASNVSLLRARFDYFSPDLSLNPFAHTWSLGVEEQFYFLLPWALVCAERLPRVGCRKNSLWLGLLALLSLSYWVYLQIHAPISAFYNPAARAWELLTGVLLALHKEDIAALVQGKIGVLPQYGAGILFLAALLPSCGGLWANPMAVASSALIIAAGMDSPRKINAALSSRPLVWIGQRSYSLYLWHYGILALARWNLDLNRPWCAALVVLLIFAVSYLSHRFVEVPFRYAPQKGLKVICCGLAAGGAGLAFIYALYRLPPQRIYLGEAGRYVGLWPPRKLPLAASLGASQRDCHLEYGDRLAPGAWQRCSTSDKKNFIYLIGNSHAQHLVPMAESAARELGYGYTALTISSCRLLSAAQFVKSIRFRYDLCKDYFDYATSSISRSAKAGDVVLIGSESLLDRPAAAQRDMPSDVFAGGTRLSAQEAYAKSIADMAAFAKDMQAKGVSLVFAGPTPRFNVTAVQCAPEWFRSDKTDCQVSLKSILIQKAAYLAAISEITAESGAKGHYWDLSAVLCADDYCRPAKDGRLLFRDRHHLSVYGSRTLVPGFIDLIKNVKKAGQGPRTARAK